jgi:ketosteroid isomerase-like protein
VTPTTDPSGDRSEIRELVERYANAADHADGDTAAALFTEGGEFEVWLDPARDEPTSLMRGRAAIAKAVSSVSSYRATQHIIASSVVDVDGDRASGETRCTAHHVEAEAAGGQDRVLYIRYLETFARVDGRWRFSRRELRVQWVAIHPVDSI